MPKFRWSVLLSAVLLSACGQEPSSTNAEVSIPQASDGDHMVSVDPADTQSPAPEETPKGAADAWGTAELELGKAWVGCDTDYGGDQGDGVQLNSLERPAMEAALAQCVDAGLLRVRYEGKINPGFAELVWRLAVVADELDIRRRILDLDSSGGQVEAAIRAGDSIGESHWTIWVREGSICHSACVFVLAAGDNRLVAGKVGIHRMMRISSKATSRAELKRELHEVYENVKDYLERNGVAVAVADLMMTVPNRSVRLLTPEELREYGLDGTNAVQDDLDRITLMRRCGEDFVRRKDAFLVAFDRKCKDGGDDLDAVNECGQALKKRFGFPDPQCPNDGPLAEIDAVSLSIPENRRDPEPGADGGTGPEQAHGNAPSTPLAAKSEPASSADTGN